MPHAVVFVVDFKVYAHYFKVKFNCNEFDEKPIFEVIRNWLNFRLRSFLCQGTLITKIQAAVSYKLVFYMWVLTVSFKF